jgi:hypothetical protein
MGLPQPTSNWQVLEYSEIERPGAVQRFCCPTRRRSRRVRRGAPDPDGQVRHKRDRSDPAPRKPELAAGCRDRRRVGFVERLARMTCCPDWDQGTDGARLPQAGGCRKSVGRPVGPNRGLDQLRIILATRPISTGRNLASTSHKKPRWALDRSKKRRELRGRTLRFR